MGLDNLGTTFDIHAKPTLNGNSGFGSCPVITLSPTLKSVKAGDRPV
ncbi:hypothetical protein [Coleofasciculus sp. FACHB-1120]|nr:hypothetical protein [Coleofasciculus sp. FACHB-1120]MBD2745062.1 hypothetical protein [Coleofasciculus sp. FACHB-1120]